MQIVRPIYIDTPWVLDLFEYVGLSSADTPYISLLFASRVETLLVGKRHSFLFSLPFDACLNSAWSRHWHFGKSFG